MIQQEEPACSWSFTLCGCYCWKWTVYMGYCTWWQADGWSIGAWWYSNISHSKTDWSIAWNSYKTSCLWWWVHSLYYRGWCTVHIWVWLLAMYWLQQWAWWRCHSSIQSWFLCWEPCGRSSLWRMPYCSNDSFKRSLLLGLWRVWSTGTGKWRWLCSTAKGQHTGYRLTTAGRLLGFGNNKENQLGMNTPQSLRKRQIKSTTGHLPYVTSPKPVMSFNKYFWWKPSIYNFRLSHCVRTKENNFPSPICWRIKHTTTR